MKSQNELTQYNSFKEAEQAAKTFFAVTFGHFCGVGFEAFRQDDGSHIYQFYSKDDPAMDDVFECTIENQ